MSKTKERPIIESNIKTGWEDDFVMNPQSEEKKKIKQDINQQFRGAILEFLKSPIPENKAKIASLLINIRRGQSLLMKEAAVIFWQEPKFQSQLNSLIEEWRKSGLISNGIWDEAAQSICDPRWDKYKVIASVAHNKNLFESTFISYFNNPSIDKEKSLNHLINNTKEIVSPEEEFAKIYYTKCKTYIDEKPGKGDNKAMQNKFKNILEKSSWIDNHYVELYKPIYKEKYQVNQEHLKDFEKLFELTINDILVNANKYSDKETEEKIRSLINVVKLGSFEPEEKLAKIYRARTYHSKSRGEQMVIIRHLAENFNVELFDLYLNLNNSKFCDSWIEKYKRAIDEALAQHLEENKSEEKKHNLSPQFERQVILILAKEYKPHRFEIENILAQIYLETEDEDKKLLIGNLVKKWNEEGIANAQKFEIKIKIKTEAQYYEEFGVAFTKSNEEMKNKIGKIFNDSPNPSLVSQYLTQFISDKILTETNEIFIQKAHNLAIANFYVNSLAYSSSIIDIINNILIFNNSTADHVRGVAHIAALLEEVNKNFGTKYITDTAKLEQAIGSAGGTKISNLKIFEEKEEKKDKIIEKEQEEHTIRPSSARKFSRSHNIVENKERPHSAGGGNEENKDKKKKGGILGFFYNQKARALEQTEQTEIKDVQDVKEEINITILTRARGSVVLKEEEQKKENENENKKGNQSVNKNQSSLSTNESGEIIFFDDDENENENENEYDSDDSIQNEDEVGVHEDKNRTGLNNLITTQLLETEKNKENTTNQSK